MNFFVRIIRKCIWKIIGADPRMEHYIDLMAPRRKMIGYAVSLMDHYTRVSRKKKTSGERGSLLGDYLEFGCYKGESFIHSYKCAAGLMPWMRFFAFDSFQGLPEPLDKEAPFWKWQFSSNKEDFIGNLKNARVDLNRVKCVSGWFDETLKPALKKETGLKIASIVYIDCDLYESCVPALEFISDIIEAGSIIMFDDWFSFKGAAGRGIRKACSEWLEKNPKIELEDWREFGAFGKSFIVRIR